MRYLLLFSVVLFGCGQANSGQQLGSNQLEQLKVKTVVGDFLRNSDGSIRTDISRNTADTECTKLGSRLPTVRELVNDAISRNTGIVLIEVSDYANSKYPAGFVYSDFQFSKTISDDSDSDKFYYSTKLYQRPKDDFGNYVIWSSSHDLNWNNLRLDFYTPTASIEETYIGYSFYPYAVRCVTP